MNNNVYIPQQATGGTVAPKPYPNVCPGCGRCRECGHPPPYTYPYAVPYQVPFMPSYPNWGTITCETKGVVALNQNT